MKEFGYTIPITTSVKTLAAALVYLMKIKLGINTSINSTAKIFDVSEKKLRQGLKGVKYKSVLKEKETKKS